MNRAPLGQGLGNDRDDPVQGDALDPIMGAEAVPPQEKSLRAKAVSGTLWTGIGFFAANVIRFGGNIVVSRLLLPAEFGVMAITSAVMQGLNMFSDIGLGPNIVQSKRGHEERFLNTAWTIQVLRSVAIFVAAVALAFPMSWYAKEPLLRWVIPAVALGALVSGFNSTSLYTLNKRLDVRSLTLLNLSTQVVGVVTMIVWALVTRNVWALAGAAVVSSVYKLVYSHIIDRTVRNRFDLEPTAVHAMLTFGGWIFISTVFTFVGSQGDRLVFGNTVTMEQVGIYGLALEIARLPVSIVLALGTAVAFPAYSHAIHTGAEFERIFKKIRFPLCVAGAFAMAVAAIAGPEFVKLVWNKNWHDAADYLPLLCIGSLFQVLEVTSGSALLARGRAKYLAIGNAMRAIFLLGGMYVGYEINGMWGAIVGVVISDAIRYGASALFARRERLPVFRHDLALYLLTVAAYGAAYLVQGWLPELGSRDITLVEHVLVDGLVITAIFAWPLWMAAKDILDRGHGRRDAGAVIRDGGRLRITFLMPELSYSGGIRTVALYAEHLKGRGHEVNVVAVGTRRPRLRSRIRARLVGIMAGGGLALPQGMKAKRRASHFDQTSVTPRTLEGRRRIRSDDVPDADVVVATWWETAEWSDSFPDRKGKKVYFVQGHEIWDGQPVPRVEATYQMEHRKITVSAWLAEIMRNRYGDTRTIIVPNGVDTSRFDAPERGKRSRPTVGFMFSEQRIKGADLAVEAIALARRQVPDLAVVTFGMANPHGLVSLPEGAVFHLRPSHELLIAAYKGCDAWLFTSRNEGFGLPVLEAMACRTPVIATPAGAAPELLARGGGILVGHEDPRAIAEAIVRIVGASEESWRAMSDAARATALAHRQETSAEAFERAIHEALIEDATDEAPKEATPG